MINNSMNFFFFQAEDGIRDLTVTGVQTCALPILGAVGGVADNVMKRPVRCKRADVELANGVTQAVAPIAGPVRITSVGRFRHPDADKACGNGSTRKLESGRTASAIGYKAARKGDPRASGWFAHGVEARPILNEVAPRVRVCPIDANSIDVLKGRQVDNDPLRMQTVVLTSEGSA